jgi:hypothetical protein
MKPIQNQMVRSNTIKKHSASLSEDDCKLDAQDNTFWFFEKKEGKPLNSRSSIKSLKSFPKIVISVELTTIKKLPKAVGGYKPKQSE